MLMLVGEINQYWLKFPNPSLNITIFPNVFSNLYFISKITSFLMRISVSVLCSSPKMVAQGFVVDLNKPLVFQVQIETTPQSFSNKFYISCVAVNFNCLKAFISV